MCWQLPLQLGRGLGRGDMPSQTSREAAGSNLARSAPEGDGAARAVGEEASKVEAGAALLHRRTRSIDRRHMLCDLGVEARTSSVKEGSPQIQDVWITEMKLDP